MTDLPLESWLALGLAALCVGSVCYALYRKLKDANLL